MQLNVDKLKCHATLLKLHHVVVSKCGMVFQVTPGSEDVCVYVSGSTDPCALDYVCVYKKILSWYCPQIIIYTNPSWGMDKCYAKIGT